MNLPRLIHERRGALGYYRGGEMWIRVRGFGENRLIKRNRDRYRHAVNRLDGVLTGAQLAHR